MRGETKRSEEDTVNTFKTNRNFRGVEHETYSENPRQERLIQESSAIGDYDNSFDIPGSSYLWVGDHHHLDRDEVQELVEIMQVWLETGMIPYP